jgi:chromosome segregation ATPase
MTEGTLQERVNRLEEAITDGLSRIEVLIRQEIKDLKSEQLADIKQTIDRVERDLKGDHNRLADDQRRLWDRVTSLERRENERRGGFRALHAVWLSVSGVLGGLIGFAIDKLK